MRNMKLLVSTVVIVILLGVAIASISSNRAVAQSDQGNMSDLIAELWDRVLENQTSDQSSSFNFTVSFNQPIPGLGNSINLGAAMQARRVYRIGSDYVCFAQVFSRNVNVECVPHLNISKVSYQEDPS